MPLKDRTNKTFYGNYLCSGWNKNVRNFSVHKVFLCSYSGGDGGAALVAGGLECYSGAASSSNLLPGAPFELCYYGWSGAPWGIPTPAGSSSWRRCSFQPESGVESLSDAKLGLTLMPGGREWEGAVFIETSKHTRGAQALLLKRNTADVSAHHLSFFFSADMLH